MTSASSLTASNATVSPLVSEQHEAHAHHAPSLVVLHTSRLLFPILLTYSLYLIANGHLTPGGGFQGGAVAGSAFILVAIAMGYGKAGKLFKVLKLSVIESVGGSLYILIALAGLAVGGALLENSGVLFPHGTIGALFSAGFMLPLNFAIGFKVAAGFFVIALMMLGLMWGDDDG